MKKAKKFTSPENIYLQVCGDCNANDCENCKFEDLEDNVTWCKDKIFNKDIEYVRKGAFIEKVTNFLNYKLDDVVAIRVSGTIIPHHVAKQELIEDFKKYIKGEEV